VGGGIGPLGLVDSLIGYRVFKNNISNFKRKILFLQKEKRKIKVTFPGL